MSAYFLPREAEAELLKSVTELLLTAALGVTDLSPQTTLEHQGSAEPRLLRQLITPCPAHWGDT